MQNNNPMKFYCKNKNIAIKYKVAIRKCTQN
jgi:hypothetical protein